MLWGRCFGGVQQWTRADPFILLLGKMILPKRRQTKAGSTRAASPTLCLPMTTCGLMKDCRLGAVTRFVVLLPSIAYVGAIDRMSNAV
jgi:hypothetical protein